MGKELLAVALLFLCAHSAARPTYPIVSGSGVITNVAGVSVPMGATSYYFDYNGQPRFIYSSGSVFGGTFGQPRTLGPSGMSFASTGPSGASPGYRPILSEDGGRIVAFNGVPVPSGATGYRWNPMGQVEFDYGNGQGMGQRPGASDSLVGAGPRRPQQVPPSSEPETPPSGPSRLPRLPEEPPASGTTPGKVHAKRQPGTPPAVPSGRPTAPATPPPTEAGSLSAGYIPRRDKFNPTNDKELLGADYAKMVGFRGGVVPTKTADDSTDLKERKYQGDPQGKDHLQVQLCTFTLVDNWKAGDVDHCAFLTGAHCLTSTYSASQPVQIIDTKETGKVPMAFSRHPDFRSEEINEIQGGVISTGVRGHNDVALGFSSGGACTQATKNTKKVELCDELPAETPDAPLPNIFIANSSTSENLQLKTVAGPHPDGKQMYDRYGHITGRLPAKDAGKVKGGSSGGAVFMNRPGKEDCVFGVVSNVTTADSGDQKVGMQSGEAMRWARSELGKVKQESMGETKPRIATR